MFAARNPVIATRAGVGVGPYSGWAVLCACRGRVPPRPNVIGEVVRRIATRAGAEARPYRYSVFPGGHQAFVRNTGQYTKNKEIGKEKTAVRLKIQVGGEGRKSGATRHGVVDA